jgi:hypothetical protein
MHRRKASVFIPLAMGMLVISIVLRQWNGGNYWHFAGGVLLGLAIVLMIGGLLKQKRNLSR